MSRAVPRSRRLLTGLVLLAGSLLLGVAQASTASAHAQIISSDPADGANLDVAPHTLTLVMSEAVELRYTKIKITDGQGRDTALTGLRVGAAGPAESGAEPGETPMAIIATLPALSPDLYRVAWTTLSSDDLHTTSGVEVFGVQHAVAAPAAGARRPPDPLPGAAEVALRWIGLIGMGLAAGGGVLLLLLRRVQADPAAVDEHGSLTQPGRRLLRLAALGAIASALAGLGNLLLQAHATGAGWFAPIGHLLAGSYGLRWGGRELAVLAAAALARRALAGPATPGEPTGLRRPVLSATGILVLGTAYSLATALTGHAGAGRHPVRVLVETVHVGAAITWVGAMVAALVVLWRPVTGRPGVHPVATRVAVAGLRRRVLSRFGVIAASCLALMTVTGLLLAGAGVATVDAAISSTYGRLLLVKLALVALALAAAATTALAIRPGLAPGRFWPLVSGLRLRLVLTIEAVTAVTVLLAAAALGAAQPAVGPAWAAAAQAEPLVSGTSADLVETLQVSPNRPGRNFVTLDVYDSRRPAPAPIRAVQLTLTGPGGRRSAEVATAQGGGRWLLPTDAFTVPGRWSVDVQVLRPGYLDSHQRYGWVVTDPTVQPRRPVVSDQPLAPILNRVAGGLAALLVGILLLLQLLRGRRKVTSAPPSGASSTRADPPNTSATAATSASPSPVPGSSPTGWR